MFCYSATVAAIVKITFLSNYGKHGDFLFDSVDITIWCVTSQIISIDIIIQPFVTLLLKSDTDRALTGRLSKSAQPW